MSVSTTTTYPKSDRAWFMVVLLYIAYMLSFIDRQIIAYLVGPIRESLHISDFQLSLIHGLAFSIFYVTLGVPLGWLADRVNRVRIVSVCVALWSAMTMACGYAGTFGQLFLARIGVGIGEASLTPTGISLIADSFPREKRHLPINIFSAGVHGGLGISNILGGVVVAAMGTEGARWMLDALGGIEPWQATFVIVGLPGILVGLVFLLVREPARQERQFDAMQGVPISETFKFLLKHKKVYTTLILGTALSSTASYGMYAWVPATYARHYGWDGASIGLYFGFITLIFGTGGLVLSGLLAGRMNRAGIAAAQWKILIFALVVTTAVSPFLFVVHSPYWTLGCLTVIVFVLGTPIGLAPAAVQAVTPNEMRAQMTAIYIATVGILGLGTGPSAVAYMTDYVFHSDAAVGTSLSVVMTAASAASVIILLLGLKSFADRLKAYEAETGV